MSRVPVYALATLALGLAPATAQAQRRFPPDSLTNTQVFARGTPVQTVIGQMRNFTGWLGVRCQYCHVGEEGQPLDQFDFASDHKRTKRAAREMLLMVAEINRRLGELPERGQPVVEVTCGTCHRGVTRPIPLTDLVGEALTTGGMDSAVGAYRSLRERYYGRAAYDFGEQTLNTVAGRLARQSRFDDAMGIAQLNGEFFPAASSVPFTMGEVLLARRDTSGAIAQYRRAVQMDANPQARQRLNALRAS